MILPYIWGVQTLQTMKPYYKIRAYSDSKGLSQVAIYYSHKGSQLYLNTGVKTKSQYFNGVSVLSKCYDIKQDSDVLNNLLRTCMNKVEKIILDHQLKYGTEPTCDFLQIEYYKEGEKMENDKSVLTVFEDWKKEKAKKIKNIKLYTTIYKDLEYLYPDKKLYFRMVDETFLKKLMDYWLYELKIQNSTINKRLICLKYFFNQMHIKKINEFTYYKDFTSDVSDLNTSVNIVTLTKAEFEKFLNFDFKLKSRSYVRDLYCISCTTGLRFSDVIRLSPDNFYTDKKGEWVISDITKTEELQLRIPLTGIAKRILEKFNYQLRKISNQKCNEYLEEGLKECEFNEKVKIYSKSGKDVIMKKVEKYKAVNFHSSRKFYITSLLDINVPLPSIRSWTGQSLQTIIGYVGKGEENMADVRAFFK